MSGLNQFDQMMSYYPQFKKLYASKNYGNYFILFIE